MTNTTPVSVFFSTNATVMGRVYSHFAGQDSSTGTRLLLIIGLALCVHVLVKTVRHISEWLIYKNNAQKYPFGYVTQQPKFITVTRLFVSAIIFVIYFFAFGLILQEFGCDLTTYLASASVIGLAISFGSQGFVQDIVIGLTLIFGDAMDVGDLVEITGTTTVIGRVEEIGLRFTKLINFYNQKVFIPNRTIANVSRFPYGGVDAYGDVHIPADADRQKALSIVQTVAREMWEQFGAIILTEPVIDKVEATPDSGWNYFRVHFQIWPGQWGLIETTFRQRVVSVMKIFDPNYADWQVPVTYRAMTPVSRMKPDPDPAFGGSKE